MDDVGRDSDEQSPSNDTVDTIDRETFEGKGPNGIDVRLYDRDSVELPSVTTILKTREEDTSALDDWKDDNDGVGDNPNHLFLFWYSRQLGTLGHWHALTNLGKVADSSTTESAAETEAVGSVKVPYSEDEARSRSAIELIDHINGPEPIPQHDDRCGSYVVDGSNHEEIWDATSRDVLYSLLRDRNAVQSWGEFNDVFPKDLSSQRVNKSLQNFLERDIDFFVNAQQHLWDQLSISGDDVIAVEQFLFDTEYEYAGQVDLVYEDPVNGDTVVADLKSSSGCYDKHQLQAAAYAKAIEREPTIDVSEVDRLEVHRTHPKSGKWAVHTDSYTYDFHKGYWWNITYEEGWRTFKQLAEDFEYDDG